MYFSQPILLVFVLASLWIEEAVCAVLIRGQEDLQSTNHISTTANKRTDQNGAVSNTLNAQIQGKSGKSSKNEQLLLSLQKQPRGFHGVLPAPEEKIYATMENKNENGQAEFSSVSKKGTNGNFGNQFQGTVRHNDKGRGAVSKVSWQLHSGYPDEVASSGSYSNVKNGQVKVHTHQAQFADDGAFQFDMKRAKSHIQQGERSSVLSVKQSGNGHGAVEYEVDKQYWNSKNGQ